MGVMHGTETLVTAGELHLFAFVRRARTNHRDDRDERINVLDVAHLAQRDHGRAFNVMDRAGVAIGDHLPNLGIFPRFQRGEVELWTVRRRWRTLSSATVPGRSN